MSTDEPTRDEIDDFIRSNDVDDRAANDLRDCPADIQRKVLARGELSTARNPSAALLARIRDARNSGAIGGYRDSGGPGRNGAEIEDFIKGNDVDESAADSLRSSSPTIQRAVLARGDLKSARNPSSALLARIRDAKSGIGVGVGMPQNGGGGGNYGNYGGACGGGYGMAGGYGAYGAPPGPGPSYPGYGAGAYGAGAGAYGAYGGYGYPGYPPPGYGGYPPSGAYGGYGQGYGASQGYGSSPTQGYGGQQPALTQGYGYGMSQGDNNSRSRGRSGSSSSRSSSSSYSRSRSRSRTRSRAKPPPKRAKRGKEERGKEEVRGRRRK